jgi:salicylate hydroxylase
VPADEVQRESWTESGDIAEMLRSFEDAEPRARAMLEQVETAFITGMYYRDPIDSWSSLRLVEDSVHVYTIFPFLPETESTMDEVAHWARRNLQRGATRPLRHAKGN